MMVYHHRHVTDIDVIPQHLSSDLPLDRKCVKDLMKSLKNMNDFFSTQPFIWNKEFFPMHEK